MMHKYVEIKKTMKILSSNLQNDVIITQLNNDLDNLWCLLQFRRCIIKTLYVCVHRTHHIIPSEIIDTIILGKKYAVILFIEIPKYFRFLLLWL